MIWALIIISISIDDKKEIHKEIIGYYETLEQCEIVKEKANNPDHNPTYICTGEKI